MAEGLARMVVSKGMAESSQEMAEPGAAMAVKGQAELGIARPSTR
jgi:hypothetical protein